MNIILHIGPHKTGTTSLQSHLLKEYSGGSQRVLYPTPNKWGPGHAELAWQLIGLNGFDVTVRQLTSLFSSATDAGVETILLSSEEFARAFPDRLDVLAAALRGHVVHLILTMTSLRRRVFGEWQELVKHGYKQDLDEGISDVLRNRPGLQANFASDFLTALAPSKASIVFSGRTDPPSALIANFHRILIDVLPDLGPPADGPDTYSLNQSLGQVESGILLSINRAFPSLATLAPTLDYFAVRNQMLGLLTSSRWKSVVPHVAGHIPAHKSMEVSQRAEDQFDDIAKLVAQRNVETVGDISVLKEDA